MKFTIQLANLFVDIESQYDYLYHYCQEYLVSENTSDIKIMITHEEIEAERLEADISSYTNDYLETVAALRKIGELLPLYNHVLCHGAAISYKDKDGFLFIAPSGTGKSTHIQLWRKYLGENIKVVNGDKPILGVNNDGVYVYGTPWAGKERWQNNTKVQLRGICILQQGQKNEIYKLYPKECLSMILKQVYMPEKSEAVFCTLGLIEEILKSVPVYILTCNISEEAVKQSFEIMTGLDFEKEKKSYED